MGDRRPGTSIGVAVLYTAGTAICVAALVGFAARGLVAHAVSMGFLVALNLGMLLTVLSGSDAELGNYRAVVAFVSDPEQTGLARVGVALANVGVVGIVVTVIVRMLF